MSESIKPYKKSFSTSYTLGAFPSFELLLNRPEAAKEVLVHSSFTDTEKLKETAARYHIPVICADKAISRIADKENIYVAAVFEKYEETLSATDPHIVLVNPSNMGNLGTIMRTALAMGIHDLAIIRPGVDIFDPRVVRASMGAMFHMRFSYFDSFPAYRSLYPDHAVFTFMLSGENQKTICECEKPPLFSLVFGNEATGLPPEYASYGQSIIIPQSKEVDSLNLTIAAGIGMYAFTNA